jgi:hypothetical protein
MQTKIDRITIPAKNPKYLDFNPLANFIVSNILKLKITYLDLLGQYTWVIKSQKRLLNINSIDTGTFTLVGSQTEKDIDIPLVDTKYSPGGIYYFGLRKVNGDEVVQVSFTVSQNLVYV